MDLDGLFRRCGTVDGVRISSSMFATSASFIYLISLPANPSRLAFRSKLESSIIRFRRTGVALFVLLTFCGLYTSHHRSSKRTLAYG
jgi:hypothetical protein